MITETQQGNSSAGIDVNFRAQASLSLHLQSYNTNTPGVAPDQWQDDGTSRVTETMSGYNVDNADGCLDDFMASLSGGFSAGFVPTLLVPADNGTDWSTAALYDTYPGDLRATVVGSGPLGCDQSTRTDAAPLALPGDYCGSEGFSGDKALVGKTVDPGKGQELSFDFTCNDVLPQGGYPSIDISVTGAAVCADTAGASSPGKAAADSGGACGHHYTVEVKAWIPFAHVVDPLAPDDLSYVYTLPTAMVGFSPNCVTIPATEELLTVVRSQMRGDGHTGFDGGFRLDELVSFDWDGQQITNFTATSGPQNVGPSFRDKSYWIGVTGTLLGQCSNTARAEDQKRQRRPASQPFP